MAVLRNENAKQIIIVCQKGNLVIQMYWNAVDR